MSNTIELAFTLDYLERLTQGGLWKFWKPFARPWPQPWM